MRIIARCLLLTVSVVAPLAAQPDRISGAINPSDTLALKGNTRIQARPEFDRGSLDPDKFLDGITLHFKPTAAQQLALEELLKAQQNPASSSYHHWLQPVEFADRFGLSSGDLAKVVAWAQSRGLRVEYQAQTRSWIRVSGRAAQVQSAFLTQLHRYEVDGEMHFANTSEPSVPATLEPLLSVVRGLDDFYPQPLQRASRETADATAANGTHYLVPADLWTIYDVNPLLNAGHTGAGQKLVVVGQSNVSLSDVTSFRQQVGLPANSPQIVLGGGDPGTVTGQLDEIDLDLEWAGGIAPNATIYYVYTYDSFDAAEYAIDKNLAPVISSSYTQCESQVIAANLGTAAFFEGIAQQANALGITWVVSSGDQGAAACDGGATETTAINGLAVNMPASIPEVTGVGGTTFNDSAGGYWGVNNATTLGSALKYVPEGVWNDSNISNRLASSGGGASALYKKPSWQTGVGVPADGARDVPDVAFAASPDHVGYTVIEEGQVEIVGGTSASSPVFAGMLALLNDYLVSNHLQAAPGLGNINPNLYRLAHSSTTVFHDVTSGNNFVGCAIGTTNCTSGSMGWAAGVGYDQATGLGSIDLANLASQFATTPAGAALTLTAAPSTMNQNASGSTCPFAQYLTLQETNGYAVDLTAFTGSADYSSNILNLFGSLRVPPLGSVSAPVCWTGVTQPSSTTLTMTGVDSLGNTVSAKAPIAFQLATQAGGTMAVSPVNVSLTAASTSQSANGTISLTVGPQQQWTVMANPSGQESAWLAVSPHSGTGPAQITVTASGAGLSNGVYTAQLVFQSQNAAPQVLVATVVFTIGASLTTKITAVANAASYQQVAAPGMYLSIFGSALAPAGTNMTSSTSPIPLSLAGVSATINGMPAAVEYASPTQVNVLLPFEVPAGTAVLGLNNNGQVVAYAFPVSLAAPGIFVDGSGLLAGAENAARGGEIAFYITGQGDVSPAITSNTAPAPPAAAPKALLPITVTIGGAPATVAYDSLAYYFEGLTQINVVVPTGISTGVQTVIVSVGGIASPAAKINITN